MKKIGILNYHRAINYGAVLQCLALQMKIDKLGFSSEVIDYKNDLIEHQYRVRKFNESNTLKYKVLYFVVYKNAQKRREKFIQFRNKFLNLSDEFDSSNLALTNNKYDKFIVGSDQVWNLNQNGNDFNYFLEFVDDNSKKNSYAASFGVSNLEDNKEKIAALINEFSHISVRENKAQEILENLDIEKDIKNSITNVLDPTLMIDKVTWVNFIGNYIPKYKPKKKFLFVYAFSGSKFIKEAAYKIAKEKDLEILWLTYGKTFPSKIKYLKDIDPMDFLYYISNSDYVITNSFHGTAFSIIFNKNFSLELLQTGYNVNSRLENIMDIFGLNHIQLDSNNDFKSNEIDYNSVNRILSELKVESEKFLLKALN